MFQVIFKYVESRICTLCSSALNMNKTWGGVEVGYGVSNWFQGHYTKPDCMGLLETLPSSKGKWQPVFKAQLEAHLCSTTFIQHLLVNTMARH